MVGRGDVRAVPGGPGVGGRSLARVLRRLPLDQPRPRRDRLGPRPDGRGRDRAQRPRPAPPAAEPAPAEAAGATPDDAGRPAKETGAPAAPAPRSSRASRPRQAQEQGSPIRGAGAAIAANMERSLTVPTATSFRNVPAKLLEVNRKVINGYRSRSGMGKVSFTHLIGYAIVRAIADAVPAMRNTFVAGDRRQAPPREARHGQPRASPSTSRSPTAAARSSCRSSATPTSLTSPASSAPTRS